MSMQPYNQPIDVGMGIGCGQKWSNFTCISPYPSIVGISKPAGDSSRWSDLGHVPDVATVDEYGHSERLSFSSRQNMDRLLIGQDLFESRFPDWYPDMSLAEIARGVGHAEWIDLTPVEGWPTEPAPYEDPPVDELPVYEAVPEETPNDETISEGTPYEETTFEGTPFEQGY